MTVEVSVTNTGGMDGAETVHWFISDPVCRISRPVRELKHFEKQPIRRGETRTFRFEIDPEKDLSFTDGDGQPVPRTGRLLHPRKGQKGETDADGLIPAPIKGQSCNLKSYSSVRIQAAVTQRTGRPADSQESLPPHRPFVHTGTGWGEVVGPKTFRRPSSVTSIGSMKTMRTSPVGAVRPW